MGKVMQTIWHIIKQQPWGVNLKVLILLAVGVIIVPAVYNYAIYYVSRLLHEQEGKTFGNDTQLIIGTLGNFIHEIEMLIIARLGGHSLKNIDFQTLKNVKRFRSTVALDHQWVAHNLYESMFDFFIGTVPAYATALLLWGCQTLFGGNTFHVHDVSTVHNIIGMSKSVFFGNLTTAFTTSHFLEKPLYFVIVILIASTALNLSHDEVSRIMSGAFVWACLLGIIWAIAVVTAKMGIVMSGISIIVSFSAYALAHVLIYLVVILIIVSILHGIDMIPRKA